MLNIKIKKQMLTPVGPQWLDVNLDIAKGEFVTIFGESGAGKTTLLRMLAGLSPPQEGSIEFGDRIWFDHSKKINCPVQRRKIAFVSQDNSLFPNMTVQQNLEYAAIANKRHEIEECVLLAGLKGLEHQKPGQLSGGQKQRVALGRALLNGPELLLLDEPLSDLDIHARLGLQDEIIEIYKKTGLTTVLVTHDLAEVFKLSTKVFVLEGGKIMRSGKPQEVFIHNDLSGKFKFTAEILEIHKDGVVNILTLSIGNHVVKVVATDEEIVDFSVGSKIIVSSKAFNPLIISSST